MNEHDKKGKARPGKETNFIIEKSKLDDFIQKMTDEYKEHYFKNLDFHKFRQTKQRFTVHLPAVLIEKIRDTVYWTKELTLSRWSEDAFTFWLAYFENQRREPFPHREGKLQDGRPRKPLEDEIKDIWQKVPPTKRDDREIPLVILTLKETAVYLKISRQQAYKMVRSGELPHVRVGKSIRCKIKDLDLYIEEHTSKEWERVDERGRPK